MESLNLKEIAEDYGVDEDVVIKIIKLSGLNNDRDALCSTLEWLTLIYDVVTLDDVDNIS
jgi:hypothetical protein